MATVHKGYRLDVELVERLDTWAEAHGMAQAEAVRTLLAAGLEATERFEDDWRELTRADEGHFDKQELNDFWNEVEEQA